MSSKKSVYDYFLKLEDDNFQCDCLKNKNKEEKCGAIFSVKVVKGGPSRSYNLKRHLKRLHPEISKSLEDETNTPSTSKVITTSIQPPIKQYYTSDTITIQMTAKKFKSSIIDMVVHNSIPIRFFSQEPFMSLNGEMASSLKILLQRDNIRELVIKEAENKIIELKKEIHNKYIYLKMDACTRHRTNYFGINVRYVNKDNRPVSQMLAIRDTHAQHKSEYLRMLIEEVLNKFDIKKHQIIAIVTDNASNMILTTEKLNDENENIEEQECEIVDEFSRDAFKNDIQHMRCAAHTLQLAIRDGLKNKNASKIIAKLRHVAVTARTPKIDAILKRRAGKGALIDQQTRWGSTYSMIERLIELKAYIVDLDNNDITLTDSQWMQTEELASVLHFPYKSTLIMQKEDLTPGNFYKEWKKLLFSLEKSNNSIAKDIVLSMGHREKEMLSNTILLAGIYVDPMNRILLNETQVALARQALFDLSLKVNSHTTTDDHILYESDVLNEDENDCVTFPENDFQQYMDRLENSKEKRRKLDPSEFVKIQFFSELDEILKIDRKQKLEVCDAIKLYPSIIKKLALVVTAMPPTQVSVERLFSALKLIKSDVRASMKEDLIESILFLRTYNKYAE